MSLGELQALAAKAARGAGLSWGLAEEAGWAVRWLEARGLAGAAALAGVLPEGAPQIALGAALADGSTPEPPAEAAQHLLLRPFLEDTPSTQTRAQISQDTLRVLNRYASRTYAPATEASRLAGAGAGLSDND
ncbi:hypothetical protein AIOL_000983 [Candidatus Rhodobacter oscarellae]|uniref:DUF3726 domain-containing protein n=2 Tax=Candidatus Rhodobacter oscarellae TaxID=1675527 RepID=A0A0J9H5F2_9RHOB|nr:hypothetical protein AIOL_000983 [Candidatus Rhodobacter lobularis]